MDYKGEGSPINKGSIKDLILYIGPSLYYQWLFTIEDGGKVTCNVDKDTIAAVTEYVAANESPSISRRESNPSCLKDYV